MHLGNRRVAQFLMSTFIFIFSGRPDGSSIDSCVHLYLLFCDLSYILICELFCDFTHTSYKLTGFVFTIPVHQFDGVGDTTAGVD